MCCVLREDEMDSLMEAFTVYVQILLSQALEPTFVRALIEEPGSNYINSSGIVLGLQN